MGANGSQLHPDYTREEMPVMSPMGPEATMASVRERRSVALADARARRVVSARRWQRRAERAARRAQLARTSIW